MSIVEKAITILHSGRAFECYNSLNGSGKLTFISSLI